MTQAQKAVIRVWRKHIKNQTEGTEVQNVTLTRRQRAVNMDMNMNMNMNMDMDMNMNMSWTGNSSVGPTSWAGNGSVGPTAAACISFGQDVVNEYVDSSFAKDKHHVIVFLCVVCALGTTGNLLVILVNARRKDKSSATIFVLTLAVVDLFICALKIPLKIVEMQHVTYTSTVWCKVGYHVTYTVWCKVGYHVTYTSTVWCKVGHHVTYTSTVWCKVGHHVTYTSTVWCKLGHHVTYTSTVWCKVGHHVTYTSTVWCKSSPYFTLASLLSSVFLLTAIAVDRYRAVAKPVKYRVASLTAIAVDRYRAVARPVKYRVAKNRSVPLLCVLTVLAGFLLSIPAVLLQDEVPGIRVGPACETVSFCSSVGGVTNGRVYFGVTAAVFFASVLAMAVLYALVYKHVMDLVHPLPQGASVWAALQHRLPRPGAADLPTPSGLSIATTTNPQALHVDNRHSENRETSQKHDEGEGKEQCHVSPPKLSHSDHCWTKAPPSQSDPASTRSPPSDTNSACPRSPPSHAESAWTRSPQSHADPASPRSPPSHADPDSPRSPPSHPARWLKKTRLSTVQRQYRVAKLLLLVTSVFILSWLPYWVISLYDIDRPSWLLAQPEAAKRTVVFFSNFYFINNAANPIIYTFVQKDFRERLAKLFKFSLKVRLLSRNRAATRRVATALAGMSPCLYGSPIRNVISCSNCGPSDKRYWLTVRLVNSKRSPSARPPMENVTCLPVPQDRLNALLDQTFARQMFPVIVYLLVLCPVGALGNLLVLIVNGARQNKSSSTCFILALAGADFLISAVVVPMKVFSYYHITYTSDAWCKRCLVQGMYYHVTYTSDAWCKVYYRVSQLEAGIPRQSAVGPSHRSGWAGRSARDHRQDPPATSTSDIALRDVRRPEEDRAHTPCSGLKNRPDSPQQHVQTQPPSSATRRPPSAPAPSSPASQPPSSSQHPPSASSATRRHYRVAKLLLLVTLVFVLSWLPFWVLSLLEVANPRYLAGKPTALVQAVALINDLYFVNNAANPIIYTFVQKSFRQKVVKLFLCGRCRR
uniref:G-protein coupled receptors family 1 profile domain-containing protein n=1 Tax=Branchiostoma floridae TaxID=7739 RepID=C3ZVA6_BRAFL|eukprot:XP_002587516.1 hypothetical protein BRAFLDRAFT_99409 [Branchiostoma floridae]